MGDKGGVEDSAEWVPDLITAVGVLLGLVLVVEVVYMVMFQEIGFDAFPAGAITSTPFIAGFIYGGYWLSRSDLSPSRYDHIARWVIVGVVVAVIIILVNVISMRTLTPHLLLDTVRWSVALGGSIGLTIGIYQVQSIERSIEAEKARRRQQELQRERDRLDKFASIVSHDLRNPLNVAEGNLELLREECDSPHTEKVTSALNRMDELIESMLTLAKAGQAIGEPEPVDLAEVIDGCWETVATANATLQSEDSVTIKADSSRLEQLFENLFRNAIDHGGDDVLIRTGLLEDANGFYVEDDGPGIPVEKREGVFEPGYSSSQDGTGFGLSIVKEIVEAHDWAIRVTESSDGGARFEITGVEFTAE